MCKCINKPGARLTGWCKGVIHVPNVDRPLIAYKVEMDAVVTPKASSRRAIHTMRTDISQMHIKKPHNRNSINVGIFSERVAL